jgi:tetratricopeptide (TPR) repeat protein
LNSRTGKWIAAATAVISLIVAAQQLGSLALTRIENAREADALIEVARQQSARGEFAQAWASLDRAASLRDNERVAQTRLDTAFAWLQDARPGPGNPFGTITDTVTPALDRALIDAEGARRADILAHLGWAAFLKWRDTGSGDPAPRYHEALAIDPANVFAHAMLGHWLMWRGGSLDEAREHFDSALAAGRERDLARALLLAALHNRSDDASDLELLRVVDDMRRASERIDARTANRAYAWFTRAYRPGAVPLQPAGMSAADLSATYEFIVEASPAAAGSAQVERIRAALRQRSVP